MVEVFAVLIVPVPVIEDNVPLSVYVLRSKMPPFVFNVPLTTVFAAAVLEPLVLPIVKLL